MKLCMPVSQARLLTVFLLIALTSGCNGKVGQKAATDESNDSKDATSEQEPDSKGVGQWAGKQWNNAISAGSQSANDTGEWVSKLYESAKEAGTTKASSAKDWVKEDWSAQGDWEYQIVQLSASDIPAVQTALNAAGRSRWDCYHVERAAEQWTFFMKRKRHSYLSKLPLRDLTRLLPMGIGNGDDE